MEQGGTTLATYIFLSTLTDEGRRTIKGRPDRIQEVNKEIEAMGAKVVDQYAVLGPYDFISIVDAVDNENGRPYLGRARSAGHRPDHDAAGDRCGPAK